MAKKLSPFEEAFKEARAEGKKTFTFDGKKYGTVTGDSEQKRIDKMPSMSRTQGETKLTQGATYPKSQASEKGLLDKYRESDTAKGFRDARAKLGDTPSTDALMTAGKAAIAAMPVGRALSAANKFLSKKDSPASSATKEDPPLFKSEKKSESSPFDDVSPREFKRGGPVKLSEAARRGDGIAIRGRTKGKLY